MKVVILGAGQVGASVAEHLATERNDITVVDIDPERLAQLRDRLDIQTVTGYASYPSVLKEAGTQDADILIAVTSNDETNIVACEMAKVLFNTPTKIARIRAAEYWSHPKLFDAKTFPVDVLISPEALVTEYILRLVEYPGALRVQFFAGGRVGLVGVKAVHGGSLVGHAIRDLRRHSPQVDTRVAVIYRRNRAIGPEGNTVIEAGDEVFFVARAEDIRCVMRELGQDEAAYQRVIIAGAGNIGLRLAQGLEARGLAVKLLDHNPKRTLHAAETLQRTLVLQGDAADEDLLSQEGIRETDLFISVTNDDEDNILSAMLAKRLGVRNCFALINRAAYVDLVQSGTGIDVAINPHWAIIGSILAYVRAGDIAAVHTIRYGAAEVLDIVAHGDRGTSRVVGRRVEELSLPAGVNIAALVRGEEVLIAHHDTVIDPEDHVIVFVIDKRRMRDVEKLFQVGFTFF